jgi:hypothetical protein
VVGLGFFRQFVMARMPTFSNADADADAELTLHLSIPLPGVSPEA